MKLDYTYGVVINNTLDPAKNNGNLQSQTITAPNLTLVQSYLYDDLNRLKSATEKNNATETWKQTYNYDRFGNRTFDASNTTLPSITPQNQDSTNPTISEASNQFSTTGYRYDPLGNLKCDPLHPCGPGPSFNGYYEYNGENKLRKANGGAANGGSDYFYDGEGRRVKKVIGGAVSVTTVFVYDISGSLVAEYSNAQQQTSGTNYLTSDMLGTPRLITTSNQNVLGRHDYLPFGEEIAATYGSRSTVTGYPATDAIRQQFTQKERDVETGLDYFLARYYGSAQGRFTSPDPLLTSGRPENAQSWNRYSYTLNNPVRFVDPAGLFTIGAGVDPNDQKRIIEAYDALYASLSDLKVGSKAYKAVERALKRLGKPGEANGVVLTVGANADPRALAQTDTDKIDKGTITITFNINKFRDDSVTGRASSLAHEGVHADDASKLFAASKSMASFRTRWNAYEYQSEYNSRWGDAGVFEAADRRYRLGLYIPPTLPRKAQSIPEPLYLWLPSWNNVDRTIIENRQSAVIRTILEAPTTTKFGYGLRPPRNFQP